MTKLKLVYIVSDIDKSLHFEWITPALHSRYDLSFILIGPPDSALYRFLVKENVQVISLSANSKKHLPLVWIKVFRFLRANGADIVHTHLWKANVVGLAASYVARVKKRIYTRHHATVHYREHPSGRKWDRL